MRVVTAFICKLNQRISCVYHFSGTHFSMTRFIILVVYHFSGANFSVNQLFIISMDSNTINKCSSWASSTDYSHGKCFLCKLISWCLSRVGLLFVLRVVNALFANWIRFTIVIWIFDGKCFLYKVYIVCKLFCEW